ncbi:MAG TPA: class I SAM-dependent methyltransferase [Bryobacteraceae bacterium]|nr:class I SAM-dependent methyltransferase [Bryobacteraceae bacterium]
MYADLARWWPLLSPKEEYVEEAADLLHQIGRGPGTLLELGCGGGSLAWHLKHHWTLTLTDVSPQMLEVCGELNPEAECVVGDMRTIDLGRTFDRVLIHDAIMYMTTVADLEAAIRNAARHCTNEGLIAILPDHVAETYEPSHDSGGHDAPDGRGLRYLEWTWDSDPNDSSFEVAYSIVTRDSSGAVHADLDVHKEGCFSRAQWNDTLHRSGLSARIHQDAWGRDVFLATRI